VIFWKPTCTYCTRLRRTLRDDSGIVWVNVWVDQEANREVRRHNGGDEYTPTALVGARVLRNPTAADVRSTLRA
jgi:mycoredoxin